MLILKAKLLLIYLAACIAGFFITADKTILRNARQNSIGKLDKST
jgi:hypothetical protein